MKHLFITICLACVLLAPPAHAATAFFRSLNDIPLMPGLSEIENEATVFDDPEGRIAEAAALTAQSRASVLSFYDSTLPQLGWSKTGDGMFIRRNEALKIAVEDGQGGRRVRILITPRS